MKTRNDPRHKKREQIVKELFSFSFHKQKVKQEETKQILLIIDKIDVFIQKSAPQWPLENISKIDLAILRLSVWELLFKNLEPPKVIIDEAVELAKTFGGEGSPKLINGALGSLLTWKEQTG